jgi:negative regulator of replication initiation
MSMKTIEIDFDVHRLIELERRGFDEPENAALRRLLKLPASHADTGLAHATPRKDAVSGGGAWLWKGVTLPQGTEVRMDYAGQIVRGTIENGRWLINGEAFKSPSDAAGSSVVTKDGTHPNLNGWMYWEVKRPGDPNWRRLQSLKPRS